METSLLLVDLWDIVEEGYAELSSQEKLMKTQQTKLKEVNRGMKMQSHCYANLLMIIFSIENPHNQAYNFDLNSRVNLDLYTQNK